MSRSTQVKSAWDLEECLDVWEASRGTQPLNITCVIEKQRQAPISQQHLSIWVTKATAGLLGSACPSVWSPPPPSGCKYHLGIEATWIAYALWFWKPELNCARLSAISLISFSVRSATLQCGLPSAQRIQSLFSCANKVTKRTFLSQKKKHMNVTS